MWAKRGSPSDPVSRTSAVQTLCLGVYAKQKTPIRHFLHNKATPVRARQFRPILAPQRGSTSRHEERRLSVATRQIALSSGSGTTSATPNLPPACKPPARNITLNRRVAQHQVCCHWQSEGVFGTER